MLPSLLDIAAHRVVTYELSWHTAKIPRECTRRLAWLQLLRSLPLSNHVKYRGLVLQGIVRFLRIVHPDGVAADEVAAR